MSELRASCWSTLLIPLVIPTQINTGMTEISRVTRRRAHSGIRKWTKPSMMT